ncbi:MAG: exonuclease domain-containing protein [Rhodocyclaceae bacterium]
MFAPPWHPGGLAFVDIETTGGPAQRESITEIGIIEADAEGVRAWSTLVRPEARIPEYIERLTGISNEMVANAPRFGEVAEAVFDRLDGRLFVAHNARFDYGYLRAAFRRLGQDLRPRVLCTVKLSRRLFPEQRRHSLDHLVARHELQVGERHRALGDADLLLQFWRHLHAHFTPAAIEAAARDVLGRPSLPPHLDPDEIDAIPDEPGVYLFYGDNDLPLYIGKSKQLRTRVLSHFSADHLNDRELQLCQQVRRIAWIVTAGEIGALIREAELIKRLQPTHNRQLRRIRDLCAWRLSEDLVGDRELTLVHAADLDFGRQDALFGFFRSRRQAINQLRALAREHQLCPPLLGLEKPPAAGRCFTHQLGRCRGACNRQESPQAHMQRAVEALASLRVQAWPYPGPIGLREGDALHVVDHWAYLGTATGSAELATLLESGRPSFDLDIYKILVKALRAPEKVVVLTSGCSEAMR